MTLTTEDRAELVYLLSALQEHLEAAIESCIPRPIPDEEPERTEVLICAYCGERPESHIDEHGRPKCLHCAALEADPVELAAFQVDESVFLTNDGPVTGP